MRSVDYLSTEERHNLQFISRQLAQKLCPDMPVWRNMGGKSLQIFIAMTEPRQPGCNVTLLKIHELGWREESRWIDKGIEDGDGYDQKLGDNNPEDPSPSLLDLFAHAFTNQAQYSDMKGIEALQLTARPGKSSGDLFFCVAHALHKSRLPVTIIQLNLHHDGWAPDEFLILGCARLAIILRNFDLSDSFEDLQAWSLHFAPTEDCIQWRPNSTIR